MPIPIGRALPMLALLATLVLQGCTVLKKDDTYRLISSRTRLYERTEKVIAPKADWAQVILFPVALPVAYLTFVGDVATHLVDGVAINPVRFFWRGIPQGWRFLWGSRSEIFEPSSPYRRAMLTTFKVIMTPPTLVASCFVYAFVIGNEEIG
jgi:hypothetical protein